MNHRRMIICTATLPVLVMLSVLRAERGGAMEKPSQARAEVSRLRVLMYHRFVDDAAFANLSRREQDYAIGVERFELHLQWIRETGLRTVTLAEAVVFARGEVSLEEPALLITIDDGCVSALERAAPLLRTYGMTATLFVTTDPTADCFARERRMTDDELRQWVAMGFDIGAHGVTHRAMTELSDAELARELTESRATLEAIIGRPVTAMAVPRGRHDARIRNAASATGYEALFTSERMTVTDQSDVMQLPRCNVSGRWSEAAVTRVLRSCF